MPPSSISLLKRPPAQPKKMLPSTLKPPITPNACALSIGSMPHTSRYDGRCVVRNTSCMPQTKYASAITTNGACRSAVPSASRALSWPRPAGDTSGSRSTRPANHAAGSITSASSTNAASPARQP